MEMRATLSADKICNVRQVYITAALQRSTGQQLRGSVMSYCVGHHNMPVSGSVYSTRLCPEDEGDEGEPRPEQSIASSVSVSHSSPRQSLKLHSGWVLGLIGCVLNM